jgi:hypothetical protein
MIHHSIQARSEDHTASYLRGTGFNSSAQKLWAMSLTTNFYLAPLFKCVELNFHAKKACTYACIYIYIYIYIYIRNVNKMQH